MGFVRVVGGTLRGRRLRVPSGGVRPTSERTREAVFDILGPDRVLGARVLDLYAGTGALGIEALSRGAERADFVEKSQEAARALRVNLRELGLEPRTRICVTDLGRAEIPSDLIGPWRLVFLDPPYRGDAGPRWVDALARGGWLEEDGILIYERRKGHAAPVPDALTLATERTYGDTTVAFYRAGAPEGFSRRGGV